MGSLMANLSRIHGERLHQQAVAEALVVENFMGVVGEHCCSKLLFLTHRCIAGRECT